MSSLSAELCASLARGNSGGADWAQSPCRERCEAAESAFDHSDGRGEVPARVRKAETTRLPGRRWGRRGSESGRRRRRAPEPGKTPPGENVDVLERNVGQLLLEPALTSSVGQNSVLRTGARLQRRVSRTAASQGRGSRPRCRALLAQGSGFVEDCFQGLWAGWMWCVWGSGVLQGSGGQGTQGSWEGQTGGGAQATFAGPQGVGDPWGKV